MGRTFQLAEARKNLSELVNQAYYEGKLFGISKGKKPMAILIGVKQWHRIIEAIKKHNSSLADALLGDSDDSKKEGFKNIKKLRMKQKGILDYKALIEKDRNH